MIKNKLTILTLLLVAVFVCNGCDLINSSNDDKPNQPTDNFQISIERTLRTIQGQSESVEILLHNNTPENLDLGGIDLRIAYDPTVLTFQTVEQGDFLNNCKWEYFTFRHEIIEVDSTNIYTVRVVSLPDLYPPPEIPLCFTPTDSSTNQLFVITFLVTNDRSYECTYSPVQFFWEDCGDNAMSNVNGNDLFVSKNIYNKSNPIKIDYLNNLSNVTPFPNFSGYNSSCDPLVEERGNVFRKINFINGGIDIAGGCLYPAARGDINLNEIAYENADAVMYSTYFVYGKSVFNKDIEKQIEQSDIDANRITLTVADLTYLIRVIVGDALPYPKEAVTEQSSVKASYQIADNGDISLLGDIKILAAHIIVEGNVSPVLLADNMSMIFNFDGDVTRILIMSLENKNFTGKMINIGDNDIISIDMADNYSNQVIVTEAR